MIERMPFAPRPQIEKKEEEKIVRFFRVGDVIDRYGAEQLSSLLGDEEGERILDTRLEDQGVRESFARTFLDIIASGLDEKDQHKVFTGLMGVGAGTASLTATTEGDRERFFGRGVTLEETGKYTVPLGSGTGGQRILVQQRPDGEYQRLLTFPSQSERLSGDYQQAFQLLLVPFQFNLMYNIGGSHCRLL